MTELNYSSFEQAVYPYCSDVSQIGGYIKQKIGILDEMSRDFFDEYILLAAGLTDASVARMLEGGLKANGGLTGSMLSRYRTGKDSNKGIKKAYLLKGAISRTKKHFEKYLLPTIIDGGEYGILYDVWQIILHDESMPRTYKADFEYLYDTRSLAAFLANVFVFAMTRDMSVSIKAIETHEKLQPQVSHETARIIRDVQIRGDLSDFFKKIKKINGLLEKNVDSEISESIRQEAFMLWMETRDFLNEEQMDEESRNEYDTFVQKNYSTGYMKAIGNTIMQFHQNLGDNLIKLDEMFDEAIDVDE